MQPLKKAQAPIYRKNSNGGRPGEVGGNYEQRGQLDSRSKHDGCRLNSKVSLEFTKQIIAEHPACPSL